MDIRRVDGAERLGGGAARNVMQGRGVRRLQSLASRIGAHSMRIGAAQNLTAAEEWRSPPDVAVDTDGARGCQAPGIFFTQTRVLVPIPSQAR
jgi:hypothetical protein